MSFDLAHIWASMGLLGKLIAGVLLLMAIASAGVTVERLLVLRKSNRESRKFAQAAGPVIDRWDLDVLLALAEQHKASALAKLFGAIVKRYCGGRSGNVSPVELAKNESERSLEATGAELRRGLSVLASVGSVAPFVGLLGTVVGIIGAFQGIASTGSGGLGAVSAGIAEALIATALGLMVAIPAVWLYNYFTTRLETLFAELAYAGREMVDWMMGRETLRGLALTGPDVRPARDDGAVPPDPMIAPSPAGG
jgi:biopolymer transport protein ExbB